MGLPKWGVVGTMDEPPELIATWAAYHIWAGAQEVHVYLDRDNPEARAYLSSLANVRVTVCDTGYWAGTGKSRPARHPIRQGVNASHAASRSKMNYLLHLDADEYLYQEAPLESELAALPAGAFLMVTNVERIDLQGHPREEIFSQDFRISTKHLEGDHSEFTLDAVGLTKFGLAGHSAGKSVTPLGYDYKIGIHRPHIRATKPRAYPPFRRAQFSRILHFEGLTPLDWVYRRLRGGAYLAARPDEPMGTQAAAQIDAVTCAPDPMEVYRQLKTVSPAQGRLLSNEGLLAPMQFDPKLALKALLPIDPVDLSCARFDQWLKTQKAAFFSEHRFLLEGLES